MGVLRDERVGCYGMYMTIPEVIAVNEARAHLAAIMRRAKAGETVFIGAFRRPEVVVISAERYAELEAAAGEAT